MKDKKMLIKFENKSDRVKGLALHPKRPWVLASLHSGTVQLWDYRTQVKIDEFQEHEGPVRGVDFHRTQPLFVTGGDDYKIKVWNYQTKRCLFNLLGHLDYIRTVQFHTTYPWILSASDDQTIRIWNWQSRQCLSVLTGHNHYVMCAQFHPKDDLVLSASLDQTVRVWDVSGLRKKNVSIASEDYTPSPSNDLFGGSDVVVKHVLEGHTRGVNWAAFHPTLSLIVSGADDREVKLWRMNDAKAWEVDTMRGHINNVSCVVFHPKQELIISNSEDKSIRVWDISKQASPTVLRRDNDRYWILAAHPHLNLLAAGHDSGMVIFKLNRERPAMDSDGDNLYYFKDQTVFEYNLKTFKERPIFTTRRQRGASTSGTPRTLAYNYGEKAQHSVLMCYDADGSYELSLINKAAEGRNDDNPFRGYAKCAVFVSRTRFAIMDKNRAIYLKNLKNEMKKELKLPNVFVHAIYPGGVGRLLMRTTEGMILYDVQGLKILAEVQLQTKHPIKYVSWSAEHRFVAMFSRSSIFIANGKLEELCPVHENSRIKSGCWDACGVFVYTTTTHIKYLLPNGDGGIIRTLENCVYVTGVKDNTVTYLDREGNVGKVVIDATEYQFKLALMKKRKGDVMKLMQSKKLVGQSIISYLQEKGFPEVALNFVQDTEAKFALALECGDIGVALECANVLNNEECWHKLGVEALRQGNHQVVEAAYQKTKNFERLSFLYLITGNGEKLSKMLQIATLRQDLMGRFHNALYLGNVQERISVLHDSGQVGLAYLTAKAHGLEDEAAAMAAVLGDKVPQLPDLSEARLFFPPPPILRESNWPLLDLGKGFMDSLENPEEPPQQETKSVTVDDLDMDEVKVHTEWDVGSPTAPKKEDTSATSGWGDDFLDVPVPDEVKDTPAESLSDMFVMPMAGRPAATQWQNNSGLVPDLIAAGAFDQAMHVLHRTIGVVNFTPLKPAFMAIYGGSYSALPLTNTTLTCGLQRQVEKDAKALPRPCYSISHCVDLLKTGYKNVTDGAVAPAKEYFLQILQMIPVLSVEKKAQVSEVKELKGICAEYISGMRFEIERRATQDQVKAAFLSICFTQCKLQPMHVLLALRVAIKVCYAVKCFKVTASLCRRLLDLALSSNQPNLATVVQPQNIKAVLQACEKENTDAHDLHFSETSSFIVCCSSFEIIPKAAQSVKCPFCESVFAQKFDGTVCPTCNLSKIGAETTGLKCFAE